MSIDTRLLDQFLDAQKARLFYYLAVVILLGVAIYFKAPIVRLTQALFAINSSLPAWMFLGLSLCWFTVTLNPVQEWLEDRTTSKYEDIIKRFERLNTILEPDLVTLQDGKISLSDDPLGLNPFIRSLHCERTVEDEEPYLKIDFEAQDDLDPEDEDDSSTERIPERFRNLRVGIFEPQDNDPLIKYTDSHPRIVIGFELPTKDRPLKVRFARAYTKLEYLNVWGISAVRVSPESDHYFIDVNMTGHLGTVPLLYITDDWNGDFNLIDATSWKEEAKELFYGDIFIKSNPIRLPELTVEAQVTAIEDDDLASGPRFTAKLKLDKDELRFIEAIGIDGKKITKPEKTV